MMLDTLEQQKESLSPAVFEQIRSLMYTRFGIALGEGKRDLVVSRLADRLRKWGMASYEDYVRFVMREPGGRELSAMVDALTTNFTSLFREPEHFEYLEGATLKVLRTQKSIAIWSAGCATGEEPYTIACWLLDKLGTLRPQVQILATDISGRALETAKRAVYPDDTFQALPIDCGLESAACAASALESHSPEEWSRIVVTVTFGPSVAGSCVTEIP